MVGPLESEFVVLWLVFKPAPIVVASRRHHEKKYILRNKEYYPPIQACSATAQSLLFFHIPSFPSLRTCSVLCLHDKGEVSNDYKYYTGGLLQLPTTQTPQHINHHG